MKAKATLKIEHADKMTEEQRKALADWLEMQAIDLEVDGKDYADKFTTTSQEYAVEDHL